MSPPTANVTNSALGSAANADLLQILLRHSPDRIYFKDLQSRFIAVSQGLVRYLGYDSPSQLIGKTDSDFFGPEHAREALEDERRITETGVPIIGKIEREDLPDGRIRWATTTKQPMYNAEGAIVGTFGISRDFTGEKALEDSLAAERNLLRSVIENIPDPIYVKNRQGSYLLDNGAHRKFLGCASEDDVIGRTIFDFFTEDRAQRFDRADRRVLESGQPQINRFEKSSGPDSQPAWLLTTKVVIPGFRPQDDMLVCISRNITELKQAQDQLRESNTHLTEALDRLREAHENLHNVQLQLIEAERLKSVGRLAAGVAHEVKNPLAVLKLGLGLLVDSPDAPAHETRTVLDEMSNAITRADAVVRGLLDFSAPRQLEEEYYDLNETIRQSLQFVRGEMKHHHVEVTLDLAGDVSPLKMDRLKLQQVFVNLLTNAAQTTGAQGGAITVRTRREQFTGAGGNVSDARTATFRIGDWLAVAEVLDNGPGIPPDRLDEVFQPFFTTKPTGQGTGLGLSVCKTIIDLHGGLIELSNRPEGGTCVTVTLPEKNRIL